MTHAPETLKAAEDHATDSYDEVDYSVKSGFLAGYDYRQKEVDELKGSVKELSDMLENYIWLLTSDETGEIYPEYKDFPVQAIEHAKKVIQTHKR